MKHDELLNILDAVRRRERLRRSVDVAGYGLLIGEILSLPLLLAGRGDTSRPACFFGLALAGLTIGGLLGLLYPIRRSDTARNVDRFYGLKDRLPTALELIARPERSPLERLQIEDASEYARRVEPATVVPLRLPKTFFQAAFLGVVIGFVSFLIPNPVNRLSAAGEVRKPRLVAVAQTMQKELVEEIDVLAEKHPENDTLKNLSENLRRLGTRLDGRTANLRESLATLSEMEGAIRNTLSEFQLESVDRSLRELGGVLTGAEETRDIGRALEDGNAAAAADELDRFDPSATGSMTAAQRQALADQLRQSADGMRKRNQNPLASNTETFAGEIEQNDSSGDDAASENTFENTGARALAARLRAHAARKEIGRKLEQKLDLLDAGKSAAAEEGSNPTGDRENDAGGSTPAKSNRGGTDHGEGTAGNPASGDPTELDGKRVRHELTGASGEGPSEVERVRLTEYGEEKSRLDFQNVLPEYRRQTEAVLESEPIPRGQRRMIRNYFESLGR